jgi:hypothetical protein
MTEKTRQPICHLREHTTAALERFAGIGASDFL